MTNKFLIQPVEPFIINQAFGEDKACYNGFKTISKLQDDICPVGYESLYTRAGMKGHNALDLRASTGQEVYATHNGYVDEIQTEEARGLGIGIVSDSKEFFLETASEEYYKTRYWHLKGFKVNKGDYVTVGQLIAYADNTGYSSGSHLHFELKPIRVSILNGTPRLIENLLQNNGYNGAINPLPYISTKKELTISIIQKLINLYKQLLGK